MNYKKEIALNKLGEILFLKSSCKTSSKISFRTLKLGKIVNITFHLQLINQSVKNLLEEFEDKKWVLSHCHIGKFSVYLKCILSYEHLSAIFLKEKFFDCPKLGNLSGQTITIHTLQNEKS